MTSHTDEPGFLDDDGPSEDLPAFISTTNARELYGLREGESVVDAIAREILKKPVFRETAALYPAWLLGCIFRERTFSDHP